MASGGLSSGTDFLRNSAAAYFNQVYQHPPMQVAAEVDPSLSWKPSIQLRVNDHLVVLAEASETPYPIIFRLRRTDVLQLQMPISIYCVCPEEAYLEEQAEVKELRAHGYGLLTVAANGTVQNRFSSIPIVQQIPDAEFRQEITGLPPKIKRSVSEAFDLYNHNSPAGVSNITEVFEGVILKAAREAVKKTWLKAKDAKPGATAATLAAMSLAPQFANCAAAIGGAQAYVSRYRNTAHHFPKNKKQAHRKYRDCRNAFVNGIKEVQDFRTAMKNVGLTGNI